MKIKHLPPIPGTTIIGTFPKSPIIMQPKKDTNIVAIIPTSNGIPASESIDELTAII